MDQYDYTKDAETLKAQLDFLMNLDSEPHAPFTPMQTSARAPIPYSKPIVVAKKEEAAITIPLSEPEPSIKYLSILDHTRGWRVTMLDGTVKDFAKTFTKEELIAQL
jgi:hypothetical protein